MYILFNENNEMLLQTNRPTEEQKSLGFEYSKNDIPELQLSKGKKGILKRNPDTDELYYEYVDRPLTPEEQIEKLELEDLNNKEAIADLYTMTLGV